MPFASPPWRRKGLFIRRVSPRLYRSVRRAGCGEAVWDGQWAGKRQFTFDNLLARTLLLENIVNMIFISINPFALKRFFFFFLAVVGLSCASCFGESLLVRVKSTPYDIQMSRIRPVLLSEIHPAKAEVSLGMVNHWIGDLRSISYGFTKVWKTPAETQSGEPADCKAKAVALYKTMLLKMDL